MCWVILNGSYFKINNHVHINYVKDNKVKFYEETPEEYNNKTNLEIILIMHNRNY